MIIDTMMSDVSAAWAHYSNIERSDGNKPG